MAFGVDQPLTTDRTALGISGRVGIANNIKPPSSRNGQLSVLSSSSISSNFTPTLRGVVNMFFLSKFLTQLLSKKGTRLLCTKVTRNFVTNSSSKLCWDVVRVPLSLSLEWRHPPSHFNSPTFLSEIVRFKSTHYCHIFPSVLPQKYHRRAQLL